jgi:hypothetical protein
MGLFAVDSGQLSFWCRLALGVTIHGRWLPLGSYVPLFLCTLILEGAILLPQLWAMGLPWKKAATILLLVNTATHPLVVYAFPFVGEWAGLSYAATVWWAEAWVFAVETFLLRNFIRCGWWRSAELSLSANLASWMFGYWLLRASSVLAV